MLRELASNLWVTERRLRFLATEIGTRMTVIRLGSGELFVHSPVRLDDSTRQDLDALGPVRHVVAPSLFHHLYVADYPAAYPEAKLYAAPGLPEKRRDVSFHTVLGDQAPAEWGGEIECLAFRGAPIANEVVFLHRPSRTLLLTDLAFYIGSESPPATRILFRLLGAYGRFGPTLLERLILRDRGAARRSFEQILAWDFDRVIVAHGRVLDTGGPEALRRGYGWLLKS
jgi:hypothetical protein